MKRVYHHYEKWEEYKCGMWRQIHGQERVAMLITVETFMRDTAAFRLGMFRAISEWPFSCEDKLTCRSLNQQAWIGHAACCIAVGSPEEVTRCAWWNLSQDEQDRANAAATEAIQEWRKRYFAKLRGENA
jgi:hypothetical protein